VQVAGGAGRQVSSSRTHNELYVITMPRGGRQCRPKVYSIAETQSAEEAVIRQR